jgi:hypothetical protein
MDSYPWSGQRINTPESQVGVFQQHYGQITPSTYCAGKAVTASKAGGPRRSRPQSERRLRVRLLELIVGNKERMR